MQVVALIHEQNGVYSVSFPDFSDCTASANDPDAIIAKAAEALSAYIASIITQGRELPQVRSLSQLAKDPVFITDSMGLMIALVPYTPSTREVRIAIMINETVVVQIDHAARTVGETRSEYLANAARQRLAENVENNSDSAIPALSSTVHNMSALEGSVSEDNVSIDTAGSLACIKEILERLDAGSVRQDDSQSTAKTGLEKRSQRLLLKPAK
jgi:predicted RNase H-like HicB family nuclease